jgi:hypothetical protein
LAEAQARLAGFKGSLAQDNAEPDAVAGHELLTDSPRSGRLYPRVPGHYIDLRGPSLDTGTKLTLEVIEPATALANQKTFVTVHRCPCPNVLIRCAALSFFGWAGIVVSAIILLALGRLYLLWRQGATDTA